MLMLLFQVNLKNRVYFEITSIQDLDEKVLIMGGDFNVLMNINLDRYGGKPRHDEKVMRKINVFMNDFGCG